MLLGAWASSAGGSLGAAFDPEPGQVDATSDDAGAPDAGSAPDATTEPEGATPESGGEPESEGATPESGDPPSDATPSPSPEATPEGPPVTIAFGGDVMFEGMIRPQLDADPAGLLDPIAGPR